MSTDIYPNRPPPSKALLQEWLRSYGVFTDSSLEICSMGGEVEDEHEINGSVGESELEGRGWRVIAKRDMEEGELLCSIPKTVLLSIKSSSLPALPSSSSHKHDQHTSLLHLALCVLHDFRLETESRWYGYLQSLPRHPVGLGLPIFWGMEEMCDSLGQKRDGEQGLRWLEGTEAGRDLERKDREGMGLTALTAFYKTFSSHLPPTSSHPDPSPLSSFLHAYSLVSTRAFLIDLYHTVALTPFSDLFNHSSTTPNTSLLSDDFVCHVCGSLATCPHDVMNNDGVSWRLSHLGDWERRKVENEVDSVDMRVERRVADGHEIWNSYGEGMGDGRLLVEWGFISEEFAGDGLVWDVDEMGRREGGDWEEELDGLGKEWKSRKGGGNDGDEVDDDDDGDGDKDNDNDNDYDNDNDNEALLCGQSKSESHLLNLDQLGRISINIYASLWLDQTPKGDESSTSSTATNEIGSQHNLYASLTPEQDDDGTVKTKIDGILDSAEELEESWQRLQAASLLCTTDDKVEMKNTDSSARQTDSLPLASPLTMTGKTVRVARRIRELLTARMKKMYRPDLSQEELFILRDNLNPGDRYRRLAMTLSINERGLLISALSKWDEWLDVYGTQRL
ncbi:hypothetical protein IAR55_000324 [Kwoniella newhampshirensis]|uniref:SET domain-containing protein n=1 Tax=Kwoniella newhampshirensis TaxID=1651941 RepID=A0AAW0Z6K1_9TREE